MGLLRFFISDNAIAAQKFAEATDKAALRAANLAKWSTEEAAATRLAYEAKDSNIVMTWAQVDADEAAAAAARVNAEAMKEEAVAANKATVAAGTSISKFGVLTLVLIALAAGAFAAYKQSTALIEKLSGFKIPDFEPKYIPQHLQSVNRIAEAWKQINHEIENTQDKYNSVATAANRIAEATKKQFEHLRKMNDLSGSSDQAKAGRRLFIDDEERAAQMANKIAEQAALTKEGNAAQARAAGISVPSKDRDQNISEWRKAMYYAANEAAKAIEKSKLEGTFGVNKRDIFRKYNQATDSGVSTTDLDAAEKQVFADRSKWKKAYNNSIDQMAANDETRKTQEQLTKQAGEYLSKAAGTALEIEELRKTNPQLAADEAAESAAKMAGASRKAGMGGMGPVDSLVKVGNFLGSAKGQIETLAAKQVQIAQQQLAVSHRIEQNTRRVSKPPGVSHYPIH
jgi:hypothetical protein